MGQESRRAATRHHAALSANRLKRKAAFINEKAAPTNGPFDLTPSGTPSVENVT